MSIKALNWAFGQTCSGASAKLVLVVMANLANEKTHTAFPGRAYLAEVTCQKPDEVDAALAALVAAGLIGDTGTRAGRGQFKRAVIWQLSVDRKAAHFPDEAMPI